jgi:hypothetical protein
MALRDKKERTASIRLQKRIERRWGRMTNTEGQVREVGIGKKDSD